MIKKKIFIACDTNNIDRVKKIIKETQTKKLKIGYKFGLEFINSKKGRVFISKLKKKIIFLDLKLNDIPNTMKSAVNALKDLKIDYLTVHISSGLKALKAVKKVSDKIKIAGVTTLTSLDNKDLREIGFEKSVKKLVIHQSKLARKANLDALICSAHEIEYIKKIFKKEIITPGIRLTKNSHDQKRVMTPREAIFKKKSDWLVIGRSITKGNIKNNIKNLINHLDK
ncbi:MAG: orotidine-5'-phosphate decarboxylase [Candidatus Pelagibacter sp.]|tara:strand:+ start:764 stop:1441 length:678 start_codon:yes stop_codon:yes gene_type:complete